jgi:WD40 repeat protein
MGVAFHPGSTQLATTGYDGQIRLWNVATGELATQWQAHSGWAFGVAYLPAGNQLVSWERRGRICLWNLQGQLIRELEADDDVASVAFSPTGDQLAACTASGQLKLWSLHDLATDGCVIVSAE